MQYNAEQYGRIESAAYELYVQKGRIDGEDVSDWLEAEKMILEKFSPATGTVAPKRKAVASKPKKTAKKS